MGGGVRGVLLLVDAEGSAPGDLAGWLDRLRRGGLHADVANGPDAARAAVQAWGLEPEAVLCISWSSGAGAAAALPLPGWRTCADVAAGQATAAADASGVAHAGAPATCDDLLRALVQHSRRLACGSGSQPSAAAGAPPGMQPGQPPPPPPPPRLLVVGYAMRSSREAALAAAGLLPLAPSEGVAFMPITLGAPLAVQGHFDVLLHKASDELQALAARGPGGGSAEPAPGEQAAQPVYSAAIRQMRAEVAAMPHVCVVDPFEATAKVVDRTVLCALLDGLAALQLPGGLQARAPRWIHLAPGATPQSLEQQLHQAGMSGPYIVKPLAACGLPESHAMAIATSDAALAHLAAAGGSGRGQAASAAAAAVPLPAVVQEFSNHGGTQYKVYVLGEQVYHTPRESIPDLASPSGRQAGPAAAEGPAAAAGGHPGLLVFDSLKSLPTQLPPHLAAAPAQGSSGAASEGSGGAGGAAPPGPDSEALQLMASWLRERLGLSLFGFDVVLPQQLPGTYLVIDVNYFPNYRGGQAGGGAAALRRLLKQRWQQHMRLLPM